MPSANEELITPRYLEFASPASKAAIAVYNTRHTFISVALTIGCNQKWIAEQTGTSVAMIQEHYGRYIRDDGDALLRAYVEKPKRDAIEQKTGTYAGTFSREASNYPKSLARPTGIEPVLRASEALVISFSLRARGGCFVTLDSGSVNQGLTHRTRA